MNDERWTMNHRHMNFGFRISDFGFLTPHSAFRNPHSKGFTFIRDFGFFIPHSAFRIPQSKGFTLIEVILIMVIIGILAATIIPRFDFGTLSTASVDGAAYIVASDIRYAQEYAMANRVSKTVTFSSTVHPTYYTFSPTSGLDPSGQLPEGVTIISDFTITFNSLGEPTTGGGGSVTVRVGPAGGPTKTITVVNYTGKVS